MDDLDAMIIRELQWRPADPHHATRGPRRVWDAARVLGLHGTTVKRRLAAMRETGLLRGIYLGPAPAIVGRKGADHHLIYPDAAAKRRAVDLLAQDPLVWALYGLVGNEIIVQTSSPAGVDPHATAARLASETGARETRFHHVIDWPVPLEKVSALDLRILAALTDDAFRPVSDVAAEVGIAAKTVTSRMRVLANLRAFFVYPQVDYSKIQGGMTVYLDLPLDLGASEHAHVEIANRFPLALCRSAKGAENGYVVMHAAGATDVEQMVRRAETIPGVRSVQSSLMHDSFMEPARWRDALLARAEELARAKGMWAPAWRAKPTLRS
jgi:DNA-binding Lrp family transcriptional regulator